MRIFSYEVKPGIMHKSASADQLASIFRALSVDTRVRIVQLLQSQPLCVNALATRLGVTQSAVSQHLRVLREAGLVEPERRGTWVHYRLNEETAREWGAAILALLHHEAE